jgi:hypothetical protein
LRAVASSRDNEDNGMDNQDSIANADESVAPSHESSVREQDYSDESMEEETPGVECGESMEEETSGVESSDASSSRDSDTTMSSQTSRTSSDDVSSNNSMDAQPSESSMQGGVGASNYNAEADDDYDDDGLAGTNVESKAEEEDSMIMIDTHVSRRQSDRNFPKTPFKNGVTGLTRLTGQEYVGLCLLVMVMLKGTFLQIKANNSKVRREWEKVEDDFILLCMLTLSLDTILIASKYTKEELVELDSKIRRYLAFFRNVVGPQREMESKSGLHFQKFHGLVHIPRYIRKLGNTFNFFGGFLERVLKDVVKQRTTRQQDNLSLELMKRYREAEVCEAASRRLETTNYYKDDLSANVDEEDVWEEPVQSADYTANPAKGLHSYAFTCCLCPDGTWMTRVPGSNSDIKGSIYPKNRTAGNNACVKAVCDDAANEGYSKVLFYYALATNSAEKGVHDIFRCHPDYRTLPNQRRSWYD